MASANSPTYVTVQNQRVPEPFHGDTYEDADDWLDQYERVARSNRWSPDEKVSNLYFSLQGSAKTWFHNREGSFATWDEFSRRFLETFRNTDRRETAQRLLEARIQKPNEAVAMFAEDMARLFRRADPSMPESKKVSHLMRSVKEKLFAGLVRNPPTTVDEFIREATSIERALQQRYRQYDRPAADAPAGAAVLGVPDERTLRQLIRDIVREEIAKENARQAAPPPPQECTVASVAEVVRNELRQAFAVPEPRPETHFEPTPYSYADVLRRPLPMPTLPPPQYCPQQPVAAWTQREPIRRPQLRRTDIWRLPDRRPLCYGCGEPGRIYRYCPHRGTDYQGNAFAAPRRQFDESRSAFGDSTAGRQVSSSVRSRSPSPSRFPSPNRPSFGNVRGRSPSPRQGN